MQRMEISSWSDFKALVSSKKLLIQYTDTGTNYEVFAPEAGEFLWQTALVKGSDDATDFETNFKSTANAPLEIKADYGRPERIAPSPQPNNTTEMWKGFQLFLDTDDESGTIDISFSANVYLKGGEIYSGDCDPEDKIKVDVVLVSSPTTVVTADLLKDVYMLKDYPIRFMSSECMWLPSTAMLRVTYTKKSGDTTTRSISALADYFKVNS